LLVEIAEPAELAWNVVNVQTKTGWWIWHLARGLLPCRAFCRYESQTQRMCVLPVGISALVSRRLPRRGRRGDFASRQPRATDPIRFL